MPRGLPTTIVPPPGRRVLRRRGPGAPLCRALSDACAHLQQEVGEQQPGCILAHPVADASRRVHRAQAALTRALERHRFQELDVTLRVLPPADVRRTAWLNVDRYATSWVTAWPSPDSWVGDSEFMEITCRNFGLPSPASAPLVGQGIGRTGQTIDAYGFRLCAASLPGDGWRD